MTPAHATAVAHPNIALIKYWGNRDDALRIPSNGSISLTLGGLHTVTRVRFEPSLDQDRVVLQGRPALAQERGRVVQHLDRMRQHTGVSDRAIVESASDFPTGAGLASSASAFAALTLAVAAAAGLEAATEQLSRWARRGSGSAARSVYGGFAEWLAGQDDQTSFATSLAPADHWSLADVVAIVDPGVKPVGSSEGHALAGSSPLQAARIEDAPRRLALCRSAVLERDFPRLAEIVELDCHLMHAVMQTSAPALLYWSPATLRVLHAVLDWRRDGLPVAYTIDAGPNVHCLCPRDVADQLARRLAELPGVSQTLTSNPGGPARTLTDLDPLLGLL